MEIILLDCMKLIKMKMATSWCCLTGLFQQWCTYSQQLSAVQTLFNWRLQPDFPAAHHLDRISQKLFRHFLTWKLFVKAACCCHWGWLMFSEVRRNVLTGAVSVCDWVERHETNCRGNYMLSTADPAVTAASCSPNLPPSAQQLLSRYQLILGTEIVPTIRHPPAVITTATVES